jgi:hypothetical protein
MPRALPDDRGRTKENAMRDYPVLRPGPPVDGNGMRIRYGGCSCGAVRFEVRGAPLKVGICHCFECRKATGSAFFAYADWPRDAFTYSGATREFVGRRFCGTCGSRLFHLSESAAEISIGALDDGPSDLVPTQEGWIKRREHWLQPIAGAEQAIEDPSKSLAQ